MANKTQHFGYQEEDLWLVRETFTGNGVDTTFQLTGNLGNATFEQGEWVVGGVQTGAVAYATTTGRGALYDSSLPLIRNQITISSISAGGLVTLSHPPMAENFYVWYWYDLSVNGSTLEDYYRDDFVADVEREGSTIAAEITLDTAGFTGLLDSADDTVQKALDSLDNLTISSDYGVTGLVTAGNIKVNTPQDLQATASPTHATVKLTNLTDGYIPYHVSDAVGEADSQIYQAGNVISFLDGVTEKFRFDPDASTPAQLILGVDDDVFAALRLSGQGTGKRYGGTVNLYLAADYDAAFEFFTIRVYEDNLRIGLSTDLDALVLTSDKDLKITAGTLYVSDLTASKPVFTDALKALTSAGTMPVDQGGTGLTSYAIGDLPYASGATTLSKLADVAVGSYLASGGVGVAPAWATLNQAAVAGLATTDSPVFATVKLSGLTDGYFPRHTSDAVGLADSYLSSSGSTLTWSGSGSEIARMYLGVDDTRRGSLQIFGAGAEVHEGGQILLYSSADYDAIIPYYLVRPYNDSLWIGPSTNTDMFQLTADGYVAFGTFTAKGSEAFNGFVTVKDEAGNIRKLMTCA